MSWATHITITTSNYNHDPATGKGWSFADRSAAFCYHVKNLLKLVSIEPLRFISEMAERMDSAEAGFANNQFEEDDDLDIEDEECPFNPYQKVIINPELLDALIADIDRLFLRCNQHLTETTNVINDNEPVGWSEASVKEAITAASENTTYPDDGYFGDNSGSPYFLFSALRAMQDIFKYARDNNVSVTYENVAE